MAQTQTAQAQGAPAADAPDAHGKFSWSEDWIATITGLALLVLTLVGIIPDIKGWF